MELTVLVLPDCPHIALLRDRLDQALGHSTDVTVTWRELTDPRQAERAGMHRSPTLLADGADPFTPPGQRPSLSYRVGDLPTVDQIHALVSKVGPA